MSDVVIRAEGLGKAYRISHNFGRYKTLQEDLINLFRRRHRDSSARSEMFWALRDLDFEVRQGEVLGIIGRNGAGKSTLLKILSRITRPTTGQVDVYGRVGSLLEVGTGFHPELTGRENIFLNGAVLGMLREEIRRKFDEIVAFAEVEQFLDTPVKRYSSGMYMRLAFSVAAHLEPEILVVDEVLAVGDAQFQRKSLGKMENVAKSGRTVLFVSHQMSAVESLCQRAILLEKGRIAMMGDVHSVVSAYISEDTSNSGAELETARRTGNGRLIVTNFHLEDDRGNMVQAARSGEPITFAFEYQNRGLSPTDRVSFGFSIQTDLQMPLLYYYSHFSDVYYRDLPAAGYIKCLIPEMPLSAGTFLVGCRVVMNGDHLSGETVDYPQFLIPISVSTIDYFGTGDVNIPSWGPIVVRGNWSVSEVTNAAAPRSQHHE